MKMVSMVVRASMTLLVMMKMRVKMVKRKKLKAN